MSAHIPEHEPSQLRAGDTLEFTKRLDQYPSNAGWVIKYSFRSQQPSPIDFSSTPYLNGPDYIITVDADTTANWLPGVYAGVGIVTDGAFVKTIWSGQMTVLVNLANVQPGTDLRSQNRRILYFIDCMIEKRASNPLHESTVEGTTFTWNTWQDLLPLQALYQVKVRNEEIADLQSQHRPTGRTLFAHFTRPR